MIDIAKNIATAPRRTKASVIRELLKFTNKPGIISFAGGLPDPELFPYDFVADAVKEIMGPGDVAKKPQIPQGSPLARIHQQILDARKKKNTPWKKN